MLDLTRVIAGPVATRTLALLGADVLRLDPPHLPELSWQHLDTGMGKRSALLDLRTDRARFEALLAEADVVVVGYRPGTLDRYGLDPARLAERRPGLVVATLSAWGPVGPWGAAVLRAVAGQLGSGGSVHVSAHLARTAHWLLAHPADRSGDLPEVEPLLRERTTVSGLLRYAPPAVQLDGGPDDWDRAEWASGG